MGCLGYGFQFQPSGILPGQRLLELSLLCGGFLQLRPQGGGLLPQRIGLGTERIVFLLQRLLCGRHLLNILDDILLIKAAKGHAFNGIVVHKPTAFYSVIMSYFIIGRPCLQGSEKN